MDNQKLKHWADELDPREKAQVDHALDYADRHANAGAPGHGQFMLIAKMARQLEAREHAIFATIQTPVIRKVAWSEDSRCWRDVETGVRVEL